MQTFLPFADFVASARSLDRLRLGKQRVETLQILKALDKRNNQGIEKVAWINHPATRMWDGYECYLAEYGDAVCSEWIDRGYNDSCREKIADLKNRFCSSAEPWWLGDPKVHNSHKAMLFKKDPEFYVSFADQSSIDNYWWPVQ